MWTKIGDWYLDLSGLKGAQIFKTGILLSWSTDSQLWFMVPQKDRQYGAQVNFISEEEFYNLKQLFEDKCTS